MEFTYKLSLLRKEETMTLEDKCLSLQKGKEIQEIAYEDIAEICLRSPIKYAQGAIKTKKGKVVLFGSQYVSFTRRKRYNEQYSDFIIELHKKLEHYKKNITFKKGFPSDFWLFIVGASIFGLLSLLMVGEQIGIHKKPLDKEGYMILGICITAIIVFSSTAFITKPTKYSPENPPLPS